MKKNIMEALKRKLSAGVLASIIVLSLVMGSYNVAQAEEAGILRNFKRGDKLPPIELPNIKDKSPESFIPGEGKPAVIMFFSVRPDFRKKRSLALLSTLSELAKQYKTKIEIIGIYSDSQDIDIVKNYMDKSAINIRIFNDRQKKIYNTYGVFMMPMAILTDVNGELHEVIPYTYDMQKMIDGNVKYLLGEWDKAKLTDSLKPQETKIKSEDEKEYIKRMNYGRIMHSKKMYGQAIREFSTAIKLMPNLIEAHIDLGFSYLATKKYDLAEASFREATKIDPDSDDAVSGLGLVFYERGAIDSALTELEKAFIVPNPRLEVIIALANIYEKKGLNEKANRLNKLAVSMLMTMYEQRWK